MDQKIDFAEVDKILELHGNEQRNLITILLFLKMRRNCTHELNLIINYYAIKE